MLALPIVAALYAALPTTSYAQGWVWRAGKWVYEIAKDSKALAPGVGAGAGSVTTGMLFGGGNAKATDDQVKLEAQRCLTDDRCRQSLRLSPLQAPRSNLGTPSAGTSEEHELFVRRFSAPPPGSATHRLLKQN